MRRDFTDEATLRALAKASLTDPSEVVGRYFVRKYQLPVTHDAYLRRSEAEWCIEMYADLYAELQQAQYAYEHLGDGGLPAKAQEAERRRLTAEMKRLSDALGEPMPTVLQDPVLDAFEQQLAQGEDVDMSALLPKGWKPPQA